MKRVKQISMTFIALLLGASAFAQADGTTGDCTWSLVDGVFTVSGKGAMADYSSEGAVPWTNLRTSIKEVKIEEGVTTIGDRAFMNCHDLKGVLTIPSTVTTIGAFAFQNSNGVEKVIISEGVTTIKTVAFMACGMKEIVIPASVATIDYMAFWWCKALTLMTVQRPAPAACDATAFDEIKFDACALLVPEGSISAYKTATGWGKFAYIFDDKEAICINCNPPTSGTTGDCTWSFSDGVLTVSGNGVMADYAGSSVPWVPIREQIKAVRIEEGVTTIGNRAFADCHNLTGVLTIPTTVATIGAMAFQNCVALDGVVILDGVKSINAMAFAACGRLREVVIPCSVATIEDMAFRFCLKLTLITLQCGTPADWNETAFEGVDKDACVLQVPEGSVGYYKAATGWGSFAQITDGNIAVEEAATNAVKIYPQGNGIVIERVAQGEAIAVYNAAGTLVATAVAGEGETSIPLPMQGVYIVKVTGQATKVVR